MALYSRCPKLHVYFVEEPSPTSSLIKKLKFVEMPFVIYENTNANIVGINIDIFKHTHICT